MDIAKKTGQYAALGAAAAGGMAAIAAGVVAVLNHDDEMKVLRQNNHRLEGAVEKMGNDAGYTSSSMFEN